MIVFDYMTPNMFSNKRFNPIVTELFIRGRKLSISTAFIIQLVFSMSKNTRLNSMQCFIMKIPNKPELQQIVLNHSSDIGFKEFVSLYKKCTANILRLKKQYLLIKEEWYNKLSFLTFLYKKFLKNKEKGLKIKEKTNRAIEDHGNTWLNIMHLLKKWLWYCK